MELDEYQDAAFATAIYPDAGCGSNDAMAYVLLKLAGEAGEVAQKWAKFLRGDYPYDQELHLKLAKELGGVLWYVAAAAREIGWTLEEVARHNLVELAKRAATGTLKGDGDDRGAEAAAAVQQDGFDAMMSAQSEAAAEVKPEANPDPETVKPANLLDRLVPLTPEQQEVSDGIVHTVAGSILGVSHQTGGGNSGAAAVNLAAEALASVIVACIKPQFTEKMLDDLDGHLRKTVARFREEHLRKVNPKGNA